MCLIISAGGVPSALAISVTFGCCSDTLDLRGGGRLGPAEELKGVVVAVVDGHTVVGEDLAGERQMLLRHKRVQRLLEHFGGQVGRVHALVLVRDHDVDAVGVVTDVLVDPVQLDLQLLRSEAHRAEHPEATCLAHGDHDVTGVGEREDRELDVELVADGVCMPAPRVGRSPN